MIIDLRDGRVRNPPDARRDLDGRRCLLYIGTDKPFARALNDMLRLEGIDVVVTAGTQPAGEMLRDNDPALIILEMRPPSSRAIDYCRDIRTRSDVPLMIAAVNATETDLVLSFEFGADDFLVQPIRGRDIVARVKRALNRHDQVVRHDRVEDVFQVGDLVIDIAQRSVMAGGSPLQLPRKEFDLLVLLVSNAGRAMSREIIMRQVWGEDYVGSTNTLDVHVKRVRKKLETLSATHTIVTVRGFGYKLDRQRVSVDASTRVTRAKD